MRPFMVKCISKYKTFHWLLCFGVSSESANRHFYLGAFISFSSAAHWALMKDYILHDHWLDVRKLFVRKESYRHLTHASLRNDSNFWLMRDFTIQCDIFPCGGMARFQHLMRLPGSSWNLQQDLSRTLTISKW